MMKPARNRRKVLKPRRDMPRSLLEDLSALVLGQFPPGFRLSDRDERRARSLRPTESLLARRQRCVLDSIHVPLVARHSVENPGRVDKGRALIALQHGKPSRGWKWIAHDRVEPLDSPPAGGTGSKQHLEARHRSGQ